MAVILPLWLFAVRLAYFPLIVEGLDLQAVASSGSDGSSGVKFLQRYHPEMTPSETFRTLAEECERRDIRSFDVYGDFDSDSTSSFLRNFENSVALELNKEDAVFMPSGVMAQSIALLIHKNNNRSEQRASNNKNKFACHETSHLLLHEQEGFQELCGMTPLILPIQHGEDTEKLKGKDDIEIHAPPLLASHVLSSMEASHSLWTNEISSLILELPHRELGGKLTPWKDILELKKILKKHDIAFHCDGARLFEASAGYFDNDSDNIKDCPRTIAELVAPFDSVYVSFYKGLGGLSGAMLLGSSGFCQEARIWLRRFGGNLYTLLPYAVSGRAGYHAHWEQPEQSKHKQLPKDIGSATYLTFSEKRDKLKRIVTALAPLSSSEGLGSDNVIAFDPPLPEVNMVHVFFRPSLRECTNVRDELQKSLGICIFHRIRELSTSLGIDKRALQAGYKCKLELTIGEANGRISDEIFIEGWTELCKALSFQHTK